MYPSIQMYWPQCRYFFFLDFSSEFSIFQNLIRTLPNVHSPFTFRKIQGIPMLIRFSTIQTHISLLNDAKSNKNLQMNA
jgi:hypothetical protein